MSNIYLELELSLDPAITDTVALKVELNRKIAEWSKLADADAKYKTLLGKAQTYLAALPGNLPGLATAARNTQLKKLREEIRNLSTGGGLLDFEVKYLVSAYSCFHEKTVQTEIKNLSRSLVDTAGNSAPAGESMGKLPPLSSIMGTLGKGFEMVRTTMPTAKEGKRSLPIGKIIVAVLLLGVALYFVSYLPKFFSGMRIPTLAPVFPQASTSYQRGVGPTIVRYAIKDYNGKEWKEYGTDTINGDEITGWDENNFCTHRYNNFSIFKKGSSTQNDAGNGIRYIFYTGPDTLYVITGNNIRIYGNESYRNTASDVSFSGAVCFLQNDEYLFKSQSDNRPFLLLSKGILSEMSRQDALKRFGQYFVDNQGQMAGRFFRPHNAVGCTRNQTLVKCENDKWSEHYQHSHNGDIYDLWVIDFDNFILVGNDITAFRDGKEFHPLIEPGQYTFDKRNCEAVWGNSMDRFWVMDNTGCVAEFRDGKAGKVVVPGNFNSMTAHWVSPEGTVFVIEDNTLYQLK